jgi:hypothetical protein
MTTGLESFEHIDDKRSGKQRRGNGSDAWTLAAVLNNPTPYNHNHATDCDSNKKEMSGVPIILLVTTHPAYIMRT